jgi:hypothetical protein
LAYQCAAAAALLAGAVILVAVHSPTAAAVALLLAVLILGPALLASIRGLFRQLSIRKGPRIGTRPLIVEDTAARRRRGKNRTHR